MKYVGYLLFGAGLLVAISGAAKLPGLLVLTVELQHLDPSGKVVGSETQRRFVTASSPQRPAALGISTDSLLQAAAANETESGEGGGGAAEAAASALPANHRLAITVRGVPQGAELSAGQPTSDGAWTLNEGQLKGLTIRPATAVTYPDTWPRFLIGFAVAVLGVVLWWLAERPGHDERELAGGNGRPTRDPDRLLAGLVEEVAKLSQTRESLSFPQVMQRVDELQEVYLLPFFELRRKVMQRHGMMQGAELLLMVALGERLLNRCWSAAADGHRDEVLSVLPDASEALGRAAQLVAGTP